MKLAIGFKLQDGPWGGGNQFGKSIKKYLENKGWSIVDNLNDNDIDLILLTEPRKELVSSAFDHNAIAEYKKRKPDVKVIHRINECDERKGTNNVNKILMEANNIADHTIFISDWLKGLFGKYKDFNDTNSSVIRNGADETIFNRSNHTPWDHKSPIKLVTHHWGGNWMKGFDIYEYLDQIIPESINGNKIEFSYIGNVPEGFKFKNSNLIAPLSGKELASAIAANHIYITGSQNEPGGMHHIEGCLCGLPPVFRISGALTEHCNDFGEGFNDKNDFKKALEKVINDYDSYQNKVNRYPYTATLMNSRYEELFLKMLNRNV